MPEARRERFINSERIDRWAHWDRAVTAPELCKKQRGRTWMPRACVQESFPWEQIAVTQAVIYDISK